MRGVLEGGAASVGGRSALLVESVGPLGRRLVEREWWSVAVISEDILVDYLEMSS